MKKRLLFFIPSLLTLIGIACLPLIIFLYQSQELFFSLILYVFAWLMDFFDGFVAKKFNLTTQLGSFIDPLADKIFTFTFLLFFWEKINSLISLTIISIALTLTITRILKMLNFIKINSSIRAVLHGKIKTNLEKSGFVLFILLNLLEIPEIFNVVVLNLCLGTSIIFALASAGNQFNFKFKF